MCFASAYKVLFKVNRSKNHQVMGVTHPSEPETISVTSSRRFSTDTTFGKDVSVKGLYTSRNDVPRRYLDKTSSGKIAYIEYGGRRRRLS